MRVSAKIRYHLTGWKLVVLATLVFSLAQDLSTINEKASPLRVPGNMIVELLGMLLFALSARFPRVCGMAVIMLWFVVSYLPGYVVFIGTFTCGTTIFAYFAFHQLYAMLGISLTLIAVSDFTTNTFDVASSVFNIIGCVMVAAIGWTFGYYQRGLKRAQHENEKIRIQAGMAQAQLRNALAQDLHDSLAADLTRLTLITENLAKNPEMNREARDILGMVSTQSRGALADLRTTIRQLKTSVTEESATTTLTQILHDSIEVARVADINLELQVPADIEDQFNRYEKITLSMLVTEATTNLMKYGKPGTSAELTIEFNAHHIEFMSTNEIGKARSDYAMTSGLGLKQLTAYLVRRGGELEYVANQGMWLLHARIPRSLHQKMLNTPLNHTDTDSPESGQERSQIDE